MGWSKHDWEKLVKRLASESGQIVWTEHAKQQMRKRHISFSMATDALRRGIIRMEPERDIKTGDTVCRMERYCAGESICICVALESEQATECIVVTAINLGD